MRCGGIFSGLATADIAKANLNNIDVINEIGFYGNWSDPAKVSLVQTLCLFISLLNNSF
jgi:hypothetical protein